MNPTLFSEKDLPQNYWFVRTESGKYYREFIENEFIAINWNDFVDLDEICSLRLRTLKDKVKEHYEEERRPGVAAAQMQTFVGTMKKSDIVLIPNARSREIAFGVITSDAYVISLRDIEEGQCPFKKRRNVKWLKKVLRADLDPYLYSLINSHHSITNAYKCRNFINRTLYDFYGTPEETHLIFNVVAKDDIKTSELRSLMNCIYDVARIYNTHHPENYIDIDDIVFKASVNSPGPIEWIGKKKNMLFILLLLHCIIGGDVSIATLGLHWHTPGLAGFVIDAYKEYNSTHQSEIIETKNILEQKLPVPKYDLKNLEYDSSL